MSFGERGLQSEQTYLADTVRTAAEALCRHGEVVWIKKKRPN